MLHRLVLSFSWVVLLLISSSPSFAQDVFASSSEDGPSSLPCRTLPSNIEAGSAGRALVLAVAGMSETFRRQCALVARASHLQVVLHIVGRAPSLAARASTEMSWGPRNALTAVMQVPVSADSVELLAHEFEHVVEQLSGLCLRTLADRGASGVTRSGSGTYETARARAAGRRVALEVAAAERHRQRRGHGHSLVANGPTLE